MFTRVSTSPLFPRLPCGSGGNFVWFRSAGAVADHGAVAMTSREAASLIVKFPTGDEPALPMSGLEQHQCVVLLFSRVCNACVSHFATVLHSRI